MGFAQPILHELERLCERVIILKQARIEDKGRRRDCWSAMDAIRSKRFLDVARPYPHG
jgi:hypothetical protein